jgi:hypothetical protein
MKTRLATADRLAVDAALLDLPADVFKRLGYLAYVAQYEVVTHGYKDTAHASEFHGAVVMFCAFTGLHHDVVVTYFTERAGAQILAEVGPYDAVPA